MGLAEPLGAVVATSVEPERDVWVSTHHSNIRNKRTLPATQHGLAMVAPLWEMEFICKAFAHKAKPPINANSRVIERTRKALE
jgi:hypothetical protein